MLWNIGVWLLPVLAASLLLVLGHGAWSWHRTRLGHAPGPVPMPVRVVRELIPVWFLLWIFRFEMDIDFEKWFTLIFIGTGSVWMMGWVYSAWQRSRGVQQQDLPRWMRLCREWAIVLFLVLVLRSWGYESFRIPSESLEPTLKVGDFLVVNKHVYGLRLPWWRTNILSGRDPQRGEIVIFRFPLDPTHYIVKRVVGLPGDVLSYRSKVLYLNGVRIEQHAQGEHDEMDALGRLAHYRTMEENLLGFKHRIQLRTDVSGDDLDEVKIPEGSFFVMGDNRDNSHDSRYWGFLPKDYLVGRADRIWMSYDAHQVRFRWQKPDAARS